MFIITLVMMETIRGWSLSLSLTGRVRRVSYNNRDDGGDQTAVPLSLSLSLLCSHSSSCKLIDA